MSKAILRNAGLPALLAGGFVIADLLVDSLTGDSLHLDWPHVILGAVILFISYMLMSRAVDTRRRAEAVLCRARDELEVRVRERTAELEQANEALRTEVAERKRIEQALRTSEETARVLLNASSESAVLVDTQGVVLASNQITAASLGIPVEQLLGSSLFDFFAPDVAERRSAYLEYILQSGQPLHFTDERAGRTYDNHVCPVCDADGRIIRIAAFGRDITERKQVEASLRLVNQRLELTQAAAGAGSWDWDIPSGRLEWSSKMFDLFGLDIRTTAASFDAWRSALHGEDRDAAERRIMAALEEHSELVSEYRAILPDGQIRWISALGRGTYDEQNRPARMSGICLDITGRKRGEAEIQHLSSFPQLNPHPVVEVDASGTITFANPGATRTLERLGLENDARAFLPKDLALILQDLGQNKESAFRREVQVGSAVFAETAQVIPAFSVVRIYAFDITERKQTEDALRASEDKFATVFHLSPDAIGIARAADGTFLDINEAFTRLLGYSRSEVVGRYWSDLGVVPAPDERDRITKLLREKGHVADHELSLTVKTGSAATVLLSLVAVEVSGEPCILAIAHDITKRKRSEEALRRVQEELNQRAQERTATEERQRLARELHDSVSQALYGISLGVNTALTLFDTDRAKVLEALQYALALTHDGLTEMRALIFELRPESLEMEGLVTALGKQTAALRARHDIEVKLSLCDEPDAPLPVKEALYRIAQEALHNAVKHARSGRLEVRLTREADNLSLEVRDNGVGFDAGAVYPGHVGLHSMRERATRAGGALEITSAPGQGTQIRARIPTLGRSTPASA